MKKAKVGARALYMDVLNDKKKGGGAGGPKRPVVSNYKPSGRRIYSNQHIFKLHMYKFRADDPVHFSAGRN